MNALAQIDVKPLRAFAADEARGPLLVLFSAYPEPWSDKNAEKSAEFSQAKVSAYLLGLDGLPKWAIEQAVRDFVQGKVERPARKRGVLPTVEEIAVQTRKCVEEEAARQHIERRKAKAVEDTAHRTGTPPFMVRETRLREKYAAWPIFKEGVSYDEYWALRRAGGLPKGATWIPGLNGRVCSPPENLAP